MSTFGLWTDPGDPLVKAPLQFYCLNTGAGNQIANLAQNYRRSGSNQALSLC